ncbi:ATP-dependent DNA ligase [Salibacterium aidingense]|uniref:ATP-dependent DNA ligase n=1 Tax=Salibacterium aidingense TaxID=384933 RepID=UPI0003FA1E0D|nr:RNA ligase family protein [Salibacterium aidingense]
MIQPMLLHKAENNVPIKDNRYFSELKLDGIRLILIKQKDKILLYTRHQVEVTSRFPELLAIDIPDNTILDGELVVTDNRGFPDFEWVMKRFQFTNASKIAKMRSSYPVTFVAFDLLKYENRWVTDLTLIERKMLLSHVIPENNDVLCKVAYLEEKGPELFDQVQERGLEGIVQKDKHAKYICNFRSSSWIKVINYQQTEVYISGYRKDQTGWLLMYENGKEAGLLELGIDPKSRAAFYRIANQNIIVEDHDFIMINPLKVKVKYRNITSSGKLRLPVFKSFAL